MNLYIIIASCSLVCPSPNNHVVYLNASQVVSNDLTYSTGHVDGAQCAPDIYFTTKNEVKDKALEDGKRVLRVQPFGVFQTSPIVTELHREPEPTKFKITESVTKEGV